MSTTKTSQRTARVVELRIHGGYLNGVTSRKTESRRREEVTRIRNPWLPPDVITLVKFACTYGATKATVDLIKAWLDYRKAKKVQVKVGDYELTIEGAVSDRALKARINRFKALIDGATYDDINVTLPKRADRRMPPKPTRK